ncbi:hypothetical protein HBB16_17185 [Pseudonocardia sp. MCCB 268]|nr:hypothetical protein [Pseudonocardia cytotoxica]
MTPVIETVHPAAGRSRTGQRPRSVILSPTAATALAWCAGIATVSSVAAAWVFAPPAAEDAVIRNTRRPGARAVPARRRAGWRP